MSDNLESVIKQMDNRIEQMSTRNLYIMTKPYNCRQQIELLQYQYNDFRDYLDLFQELKHELGIHYEPKK